MALSSVRSLRGVLAQLARPEESPRHDRPRFHPFPARMPIWLARGIIEELTDPGDTVLDQVVGSSTTAIAGLQAGRAVAVPTLTPWRAAARAGRDNACRAPTSLIGARARW